MLGVFIMALIISIIGLKSKNTLLGFSWDILGAFAFLTELVFFFGIIDIFIKAFY